jgi:putative nucleotidyltransferase with HDIG domain
MATSPLAERFARDLDGVSDLPSFGPVVGTLLRTLDRRDVALAEVIEIVREDPGLAAQMLRVANSAVYAGRAPAATIRDALLRLGLREVRRLALLLSVYNSVRPPGALVDTAAFWAHSLAVARAAELLAEHVPVGGEGPEAADALFLAGLFHDLGYMVLAAHYPSEFFQVRDAARAGGRAFFEVEAEVLGTDHAAMSVRLARHWGLAPLTVAAIDGHHRTGPADPDDPGRLLRLGEALCHTLGLHEIGEGSSDPTACDDLGLAQSLRRTIAERARQESARAAVFVQAAG